MLDYILCEIYRSNGYFLQWDNRRCFLVSDGAGCGCGPDYISEFISGCLRCSFFDERVFNAFGVLTSAGIQRRYIRMFNGRDFIQIQAEYWLLDVANKKDVPASVQNKINFLRFKSTENPDKSTENPDKSTENPQSTVKKNTLNESTSNDDMRGAAVADSTPDESPVVARIPLNDKTEYLVHQSAVDHYAELYPAVDVPAELRKMQGWCETHPKKRKTRRGVQAFITSWLSKTQDRGGVSIPSESFKPESRAAVSYDIKSAEDQAAAGAPVYTSRKQKK